MVAAYSGYAALCEKLLAKGADVLHFVEKLDQHGNVTAVDDVLDRAKCSGDPRTLQVIEPAWLRARWTRAAAARISDPVTFLQSGWECLLDAARLGMADLCANIIVAGVPLKHKHPRYEGNTPLQLAADYGQLRTCALMVALGADSAYLDLHENIPPELERALDAVGQLVRDPDIKAAKTSCGSNATGNGVVGV